MKKFLIAAAMIAASTLPALADCSLADGTFKWNVAGDAIVQVDGTPVAKGQTGSISVSDLKVKGKAIAVYVGGKKVCGAPLGS